MPLEGFRQDMRRSVCAVKDNFGHYLKNVLWGGTSRIGVMKVVLEMMGDVVGLDYGGAMEMRRTGCYQELFWR